MDRAEEYGRLLELGLDVSVADQLADIFGSGRLSPADLDGRALDALKEFPVEEAVVVLEHFLQSDLEHVANKSAFLCGVMRSHRQRARGGAERPRHPELGRVRALLAKVFQNGQFAN